MKLALARRDGATIAALDGRFDAHETTQVGEALRDAAANGNVVVDLGAVNFIDSSALSLLVQAMKRARESGADLALAQLQSPVRVIFELTRLDRAFSIHPTVEDAVASFTA
jgi:anti-sigma B factor antagonist